MAKRTVELSPGLLSQIAAAVGSIRYGTVQITIHDAQIVQIEKAEKIRISTTEADLTTGGAATHIPAQPTGYPTAPDHDGP